jgi:hypothetical protein
MAARIPHDDAEVLPTISPGAAFSAEIKVMRPTSPPRMGWRVLMGQLVMKNQVAILDQEQQSKTLR